MTRTGTEESNVQVVRRFFEVGPSKGDIGSADSLLAPEFSLHTPLPTPGPGIEAMNNVIVTCRAAFHNLHVHAAARSIASTSPGVMDGG